MRCHRTAGMHFQHNSGAYGGKLLPETLGSGCAFLDYDADGWQDILLVNAMDWPGHKRGAPRCSSITTIATALSPTSPEPPASTSKCTEWALPSAITTTTAFPTFSSPASARIVSSATPAKAHSSTSPKPAASLAASGVQHVRHLVRLRSRRPARSLRLQLRATGRPSTTFSAASTESTNPIARRKRIAAKPAGCFTIAAMARFEDVTATSGIFDSSSKSLGVAMLDFDRRRLARPLVANDTQPNKLYRNLRNGKFKDVAVEAGLAFSAEGKARAGMGVDVGDFENSGRAGIAITNFDNEMIGLYRALATGVYDDIAIASGVGNPSQNHSRIRLRVCRADLDGSLDLVVANGHIDETVRNIRGNVGYAQPPQLFLNAATENFTMLRRTLARILPIHESAAAWRTEISTATATSIFC